MKAILFDFNGTLFFDGDINKIAWKQTIDELSNNTIDFEKVYLEYRSVRNNIFVEAMLQKLNKKYTKEDIEYWASRKETEYYQKYCINNNRNQLAPGAEKFLDYLKVNNIPINLCTASLKVNVDFYFDYLKIDRWFDRNIIAYDTGEYSNKVDMYKACAKNINQNIEECIVIEDSPTSIKQAIMAGSKNIVALKKEDTPDLPEIKILINDFNELDYDKLMKL